MLRMFNELDGWGLIYNSLLLTHDGGLNWFSVPMSEGQVNENTRIFFTDVNNFYLVVPAPDGLSGQLYFTYNGGGSWLISPVPFVDGQLIFGDLVGYFLETKQLTSSSMSIKVHSSIDNGASWEQVFPPVNTPSNTAIPDEGLKTGISFISMTRGWIGLAAQSQKVSLYKTDDGGRTWITQEIPVPQNIPSLETSAQPPVFFKNDDTRGLLPIDFVSSVTGDRTRVFYATTDAGDTWIPGDSLPEGGAFDFIDPKTGWSWGKQGLYFTTDAAKTWQLLPVAFGYSEHATSITFSSPSSGFILTADLKNRVRIYKTQDAGSTWTAVNP